MQTRSEVPSRLNGLRGTLGTKLPMLGTVVLLWAGTRLAFVLVSFIARYLQLYNQMENTPPQFSGLILSWWRWDTNWYMLISRLGYFSPETTNFFPLYPLSVGAVSWLLGDGSGPIFPHPDKLRLLVGMGLSNLGLLVGLYAIACLAAQDGDPPSEDTGGRAVRLALAYPFALAWTVAYAEGYFLAFSALTLLFARRERWYLAALTALLAGFSRPVALILILPLAYEYGRRQGWWQRIGGFLRARFIRSSTGQPGLAWRGERLPWGGTAYALFRGIVVVGAVPAALVCFSAYSYYRFGNFFLPTRTHFLYWGSVPRAPWWTISAAVKHLLLEPSHTGPLFLELGAWILFALVTLVSIRRTPFLYTLYMAGLLYMSIASPTPSQVDLIWGAGRYLAAAIPVYLIAAGWLRRRPGWDGVVLACGLILQGALAIGLFQGAPVL